MAEYRTRSFVRNNPLPPTLSLEFDNQTGNRVLMPTRGDLGVIGDKPVAGSRQYIDGGRRSHSPDIKGLGHSQSHTEQSHSPGAADVIEDAYRTMQGGSPGEVYAADTTINIEPGASYAVPNQGQTSHTDTQLINAETGSPFTRSVTFKEPPNSIIILPTHDHMFPPRRFQPIVPERDRQAVSNLYLSPTLLRDRNRVSMLNEMPLLPNQDACIPGSASQTLPYYPTQNGERLGTYPNTTVQARSYAYDQHAQGVIHRRDLEVSESHNHQYSPSPSRHQRSEDIALSEKNNYTIRSYEQDKSTATPPSERATHYKTYSSNTATQQAQYTDTHTYPHTHTYQESSSRFYPSPNQGNDNHSRSQSPCPQYGRNTHQPPSHDYNRIPAPVSCNTVSTPYPYSIPTPNAPVVPNHASSYHVSQFNHPMQTRMGNGGYESNLLQPSHIAENLNQLQFHDQQRCEIMPPNPNQTSQQPFVPTEQYSHVPATDNTRIHSNGSLQSDLIGVTSISNIMKDFATVINKGHMSSQQNLRYFTGDDKHVSVEGWLEDFDRYIEERHVSRDEQVAVLLRHLSGSAKDELKCYSSELRDNINEVRRILKDKFTSVRCLADLHTAFSNRDRQENETSDQYSRELSKAYQQIIDTAPTESNRASLHDLRDQTLKGRFRRGMKSAEMSVEMRRLELDKFVTFNEMRDQVANLFLQEDIPSPKSKKQARVNAAQSSFQSAPQPFDQQSQQLVNLVQVQQQQLSDLMKKQEMMSKQLQAQTTALNGLKPGGHIIPTPPKPTQLPPVRGNINPSNQGERNHVASINRTVPHVATAEDICTFCSISGHFRSKCPTVRATMAQAKLPSPSGNESAPKL